MDDVDMKLLRAIQDGIPLTTEPFVEVAKKIGVTEDEVMARLKKLKNNGTIKRFAASINHRKLENVAKTAMTVWKVPQNFVETVGRVMSAFNKVTHCYNRQTIPGKWEYNLFAVIHEHDREAVKRLAQRLSEATGIKDYEVLFSVKEFKRASASRIPYI
jgi:DNA-binding Lrp family transcriptional regulator